MKKKYWELNHPILRIIQHLAFWVLSFLVFLYLFKSGAKPEKIDYVYTILFQLTLLPAVYLNIELLLPTLGNRRRILFYLFSLAVVVIFFTWINYNFFDKWSAKVFPDYFFISYFTFREILLFFSVYIIISTLLKLSKSWFLVSGLQKELLEKEKQKTEVELKALKAQINPHFFFNTLNNIYVLTAEDPKVAGEAIHQLSKMMRYLLYDTQQGKNMLSQEIAFVKNYIHLMKLRMTDVVRINIDTPVHLQDMPLAPMILLPFVENAFKHGVSATQQSYVDIIIMQKEKVLDITVNNSIMKDNSLSLDSNSGIGLVNTRRRLDLLYPGRYKLDISTTNATAYSVHLILDLS